MSPVTGLKRTLGPLGASAIGVASMVGAGVFYVFAPAASLAGSWVLLSLAIAGFIAMVNALSVAQLSLHYPATGGVYSFATHYVSPRVGFLAGWLFLAGKTASAGAIALVAASYLAPDYAPVVAAACIAVFAIVNITGVKTTAALSFLLSGFVVTVLAVTSTVSFTLAPAGLDPVPSSPFGVAQAAGLFFFAFAGYARMATLGEEVINPKRVLPRVIVGTLVGVLALYALVGTALIRSLGVQDLAVSVAPVAELVAPQWQFVVVSAAVVASLGSLLTILAALSRVSLAMARDGNLPGALATIWSKTSSPAVSEAVMASMAIVLVFTLDPLWLVGASSGSVLLYYAISHWSALAQPASERVIWRALPVVGLLVCVLLVVTLPTASVMTTVVILAVGLVIGQVLVARRR